MTSEEVLKLANDGVSMLMTHPHLPVGRLIGGLRAAAAEIATLTAENDRLKKESYESYVAGLPDKGVCVQCGEKILATDTIAQDGELADGPMHLLCRYMAENDRLNEECKQLDTAIEGMNSEREARLAERETFRRYSEGGFKDRDRLASRVAELEAKLKQFDLDVLSGFVGLETITPLEGFVKSPHCLPQCFQYVRKEIETLRQRVAELERDAKRLDWWEKHRNVSIGYDPDDESSKDFVLYRETGSVNDREWSVIARGHSLRAAIDSALEPPC